MRTLRRCAMAGIVATAAAGAGAQTLGFGQVGIGEHGAGSATAGVVRDVDWTYATRAGTFGATWDAAVATWTARREDGERKWYAQIGVTPTLRLFPAAPSTASGWFVEAGIGANLVAPHYHSRDNVFSTYFQFGDHVGTGWRFGGSDRRSEVSLRLEHFSNASIKTPNPGENFVQVRYAVQY